MKALVIGAGISGYGAAALLVRRGFRVIVSEQSIVADEAKARFIALNVELRDGGHHNDHIDGVSLVVPSPGLPTNHSLLKAAIDHGLKIVSEIDLSLEGFTGTVYGVTGTNGKSTTVAMIDFALKKLGLSSAPAGNFGDPPSLMIAERRMPSNLVLELSSYQLEQSQNFTTNCALITSFSTDHLARHGTEENYFDAKWKLFERTKSGGIKIVSQEVAAYASKYEKTLPSGCFVIGESRQKAEGDFVSLIIAGGKIHGDGLKPLAIDLRHVSGTHNLRNAAFAALAIHKTADVPLDKALDALRDFRGLPYRFELIGHYNGQAIYNDSKSTNVESTLVALDSMTNPCVLLMGGIGKGESYAPLLSRKDKIARLYTFGPSGPEIEKALKDSVPVKNFPTLSSLFQSFTGIIEESKDDILFSPGCASFDEFRNFMHRGEFFSHQVRTKMGPDDQHDKDKL